jgi:hypothetical protein
MRKKRKEAAWKEPATGTAIALSFVQQRREDAMQRQFFWMAFLLLTVVCGYIPLLVAAWLAASGSLVSLPLAATALTLVVSAGVWLVLALQAESPARSRWLLVRSEHRGRRR